MFTLYSVAVGTFSGLLVGALTAAIVFRRLTVRLRAKESVLRAAVALENRRIGHDSGRNLAPRRSAGDPAKIDNIAVTRTGALTQYHLEKRRQNR